MVDLTTTTYALVGAAASTSYVLFSNVGLSQMGTVALLNGRIVKGLRLTPADKVRAWAEYFRTGAKFSLGPTFLSLLLDIYIYRTHPSAQVGRLSLLSGIVGATIVPYTLAFLGSTNAQLLQLDREAASGTGGGVAGLQDNPRTQEQVDGLLQTWEARHFVRYVAWVGAWAGAMAALVLDARV